MQTEIEAKFPNINIAEIKAKLEKLGAKCVKPRRLMKRTVFGAYNNSNFDFTYARVRDEGDKITMSLKIITEDEKSVSSQKELCLEIDNYENGVMLLDYMKIEDKMVQENYRETYELNGCEVEIEEWPFLNPYIEIEAEDAKSLEETAKLLELGWENRNSSPVSYLYKTQYATNWDGLKGGFSHLRFDMENPFV